MSRTRRLSQNQFIGERVDLPLKMVEGAQYIAVDTKELYIYDSLEDPVLIATASEHNHEKSRLFLSAVNINAAVVDAPTENEVETWNDGLPTPYSNVVCHYTGTDTSTDDTLLAFHIDADGQATSLGGGSSSQWTDVTGGINYAGGNVGIGATNPGAKLEVIGASGYVLKTDGDIALTTYAGDTKIDMSNNSLQLLSPSGNVQIGDTESDGNETSIQVDDANSKVVIEGNVGIGVDTPTDPLQVLGDMKLLTSNGKYISIRNSSSSMTINGSSALGESDPGYFIRQEDDLKGAFAFDDDLSGNDIFLWNYTADGNMRFGVADAEKMRILPDGNVSIGTEANSARLDIRETNVANDSTIGINLDINKENTSGSGFLSNVNGIKAYSKGNSSETIVNIAGVWGKAEHIGTGRTYYITGGTNRGYHSGTGDSNAISGIFSEAKVGGTGVGNHEYVVGVNAIANLDNPNADVQYLQGQHCTVKLNAGEVTDNLMCLILDLDHTGGTISGDFEYLRIQGDALDSAVGGTARAINSLSTHPSEFAGSIQSPTFNIGSSIDYLKLNGDSTISLHGDSGIFLSSGDGVEIEISDVVELTGASFLCSNSMEATSFVVTGGASNEFLMADGSAQQASSLDIVLSSTTSEPSGSDSIANIVSLTQAEYDAGLISQTTLYIITDA